MSTVGGQGNCQVETALGAGILTGCDVNSALTGVTPARCHLKERSPGVAGRSFG